MKRCLLLLLVVVLFSQCHKETVSHQPRFSPSLLVGGSAWGYQEGKGTQAIFGAPLGLALDDQGNLYCADNSNRVRKITPEGVTSLVAGDGTFGFKEGTGVAAKFYQPSGISVDSLGNVYIADWGNNAVRKIDPKGATTLIAGGIYGYSEGNGSSAYFADPLGLAIDKKGYIYISDEYNHRIRKISLSGSTSLIAGDGFAGYLESTGSSAEFSKPCGLTIDREGNLYVTDFGNNRIRKITPQGETSLVLVTGEIKEPEGIAVDDQGNLYFTDYYGLHKLTPKGVVSTITTFLGKAVTVNKDGTVVYYGTSSCNIYKFTLE